MRTLQETLLDHDYEVTAEDLAFGQFKDELLKLNANATIEYKNNQVVIDDNNDFGVDVPVQLLNDLSKFITQLQCLCKVTVIFERTHSTLHNIHMECCEDLEFYTDNVTKGLSVTVKNCEISFHGSVNFYLRDINIKFVQSSVKGSGEYSSVQLDNCNILKGSTVKFTRFMWLVVYLTDEQKKICQKFGIPTEIKFNSNKSVDLWMDPEQIVGLPLGDIREVVLELKSRYTTDRIAAFYSIPSAMDDSMTGDAYSNIIEEYTLHNGWTFVIYEP